MHEPWVSSEHLHCFDSSSPSCKSRLSCCPRRGLSRTQFHLKTNIKLNNTKGRCYSKCCIPKVKNQIHFFQRTKIYNQNSSCSCKSIGPVLWGDFSFSFSITALKSVAAVNNMIPDENKNKMKHKADFNKNQVLHTKIKSISSREQKNNIKTTCSL
jgi:hypothetical protein